MTFFDCTAALVGQLNGNGHKGMLQIDAAPVENFWLRHWPSPFSVTSRQGALRRAGLILIRRFPLPLLFHNRRSFPVSIRGYHLQIHLLYVVFTRMGAAPDDDASRKRGGEGRGLRSLPELIGCSGTLRRARKCGRGSE